MIRLLIACSKVAIISLVGSLLLCLPLPSRAQDVMKRPLLFTDFLSSKDASLYYGTTSSSQAKSLADLQPSGLDWLVWCVEEQAPVFDKSSAKTIIGNLNFKEPLLVLQATLEKTASGQFEHWLKIRRNDSNASEGWVRASSLMLSPWALKTTGGAGRKVIAVPGFSNGRFDRNYTRREVYNHRKTRDSDAIRDLLVDKFRILYVLRESNTAYLLSNSPTLEGGNAKQAITGWMPKDDVSEWNRRLAYGPQFGGSLQGQKVPLFSSEEEVLNYLQSCDAPKTLGTLEIVENERIPTVPAFPCIDSGKSSPENPIRKILLIDGFSMEVTDEIEEFIQELQALKNQLGKLNLFFIVDATGSMKKYYPPIANSILNLSRKFNSFSQGDKVSLKVGFGIYKDYVDNPPVITVKPQAFDEAMANDIKTVDCSSLNPKPEEAVYNGVIQNLTDFEIDPSASNVIIIIGDEGNHAIDPKGLDAKVVGNQLVNSKASVFVFQSTSFMTESSNRFQKDALDWIHMVAKSTKMNLKQLEDGVIGNSMDQNTTPLLEQRHVKLITPKTPGKPASPSEMEKLISDDIEGWISSVQSRIDELGDYIGGGTTKRTEAEKQRLIKDAMDKWGVSYETASAMVNNQGDSAYPVFCSVQSCSAMGSTEVMKPYVFLSRIDFKRIDDSFKQLAVLGTKAKNKENLSVMCENLILTQVGTAAQLPGYMDNTINDIWLEFFQVECNIPALRDIELGKIRAMPEDQFDRAYESMMLAYEDWKFMARSLEDYEWKIARGNTKYYWVPADYFPGFSN